MKKIATIPYDDVEFVWVSNHYDVHLSGLCKMGNTLFWFQTRILDDYDNIECDIYMLSFWEEMKLRFRKFSFERMVGFHWSYPQRKEWAQFYYKKPIWLNKLLFKLYYLIRKIM
jgi:hypothetical protein